MRKSQFSDHQILSIRKQAETGTSVPDMCGEDKQIPILSDIGKIRGQSSKNPTPDPARFPIASGRAGCETGSVRSGSLGDSIPIWNN